MINGSGKSGLSYPDRCIPRLGLVATKIDEILREATIFDRRLRLSAMAESNSGLGLGRARRPQLTQADKVLLKFLSPSSSHTVTQDVW